METQADRYRRASTLQERTGQGTRWVQVGRLNSVDGSLFGKRSSEDDIQDPDVGTASYFIFQFPADEPATVIFFASSTLPDQSLDAANQFQTLGDRDPGSTAG